MRLVASLVHHNRIRLNLNQHIGIDQTGDRHHAASWRMPAEEFSVGTGEVFPIGKVGNIHSGSYNVREIGTQVLEGYLDDFKAALGLGVGIAGGVGTALPV